MPKNTIGEQGNLDAQILRSEYETFKLKLPRLVLEGDSLALYTTCSSNEYSFNDVVRFNGPNLAENFERADKDILHRLTSIAGFIIATSYWKALTSPKFDTSAAELIETRSGLWDRFMTASFGEFAYRNGLTSDVLDGPLVSVLGTTAHRKRPLSWPTEVKPLVLFSGGKDSSAAIEFFQTQQEPFSLILFNPSDSQREKASQVGAQSTYELTRTLDPLLFELNDNGYLNGHTPFSAMLAVLGLILATITEHNQVVAANTRSDETSNLFWEGQAINHQWSKSIEFEMLLKELVDSVGGPRYISIFRPLYELQLVNSLNTRSFASCNQRLAEGTWCGQCPKCIWIWVAIAALDSPADATTLIGADPRHSETSMEILRDMAGLGTEHPFECTGSPEEVAAALDSLNIVLDSDAQSSAIPNATLEQILSSWGDDSLLLDSWRNAVKRYATE